MKKALSLLLMFSMLFTLAACSGGGGSSTPAASTPAASTGGEGDDTPAAEVKLADYGVKPGTPITDVVANLNAAAGTADHSDDDLSVEVALNVIGGGWVAEPIPEDNVMNDYVKEKLNIDLNYTAYVDQSELIQQVTLAFASSDPPDMAFLDGGQAIATAQKLAEQGLVLNDWNPYLDKIPALTASCYDWELLMRSTNGKLFGIPKLSGNDSPVWQAWIRQDWLDNLNLEMPKTPQDLMDIAYAFTYDDPDGNGIDDTFGFTDGGGSANGDLLWITGILSNMFSVPSLELTDGEPTIKYTNDKWKDALMYMQEMVEKKVIDPDWNTQDWQKCYDKIRAGTIGIVYMWMPGGMTVMEGMAGGFTADNPNTRSNGEEWQFDDWSLIQTDGYKMPDTWDQGQGVWVISAKAAQDPVKLNRIFHYIDYMTAPNEGGIEFGLVAAPAGGVMSEAGIGKRTDWAAIDPASLTNYRALAWYSMPIMTEDLTLLPWYAGDDPEFQQKVVDGIDQCTQIPTFKEYGVFVTIPDELTTDYTDLEKYRLQTQIDFILGRKSFDEWDDYVDTYLNDYAGQKVADAYKLQLAELGLE